MMNALHRELGRKAEARTTLDLDRAPRGGWLDCLQLHPSPEPGVN